MREHTSAEPTAVLSAVHTPVLRHSSEHPAAMRMQSCLSTASLQNCVWTKRAAPKSPNLPAPQLQGA